MKVIVTGATGLVGAQVLRECIANDNITHVYAFSRRQIQDNAIAKDPKVEVILHDDFTTWPASVVDRVSGAEACLWAIGGMVGKFPSVEACKVANVDATLAAAKGFVDTIAPKLGSGKKFRFVLCSGMGAEWDQDKKLWFLNDTRKIKGQVEKGLFDIQDAHPGQFEAYTLRPSGIQAADVGMLERAMGKLYGAVELEDVARAMVVVGLKGNAEHIIPSDKLKGFR